MKRRDGGFTLVEVMVATAVVAIVVLAVARLQGMLLGLPDPAGEMEAALAMVERAEAWLDADGAGARARAQAGMVNGGRVRLGFDASGSCIGEITTGDSGVGGNGAKRWVEVSVAEGDAERVIVAVHGVGRVGVMRFCVVWRGAAASTGGE